MIEGAEGMACVLPEAASDPSHLLEQPSVVACYGGMVGPAATSNSLASPLTRELVAQGTLDRLLYGLAS
jgi:hypothetical protein